MKHTDSSMEIVNITIRNNTYQIACSFNERKKLLELADRFGTLVNSLSGTRKNTGSDSSVFLLAALILEDKIDELNNNLKETLEEFCKYKIDHEKNKQVEKLISYSIKRLENISDNLKRSESL